MNVYISFQIKGMIGNVVVHLSAHPVKGGHSASASAVLQRLFTPNALPDATLYF